jgi:hypothetical protein
MFGRPSAYRAVPARPGRIKIRQNLPAVAYRAKSVESGQPVFTSMDEVLTDCLFKTADF